MVFTSHFRAMSNPRSLMAGHLSPFHFLTTSVTKQSLILLWQREGTEKYIILVGEVFFVKVLTVLMNAAFQ